jgi:hypothetical protein
VRHGRHRQNTLTWIEVEYYFGNDGTDCVECVYTEWTFEWMLFWVLKKEWIKEEKNSLGMWESDWWAIRLKGE